MLEELTRFIPSGLILLIEQGSYVEATRLLNIKDFNSFTDRDLDDALALLNEDVTKYKKKDRKYNKIREILEIKIDTKGNKDLLGGE